MPKLSSRCLLTVLTVIALIFSAFFMFYNIKGAWGYALSLRGQRLLSLVVVAYAIAVSTVLFQTITHNRILTPAIMGFDRLYQLIQTVIVFAAGTFHLGWFNDTSGFFIETALLTVFAVNLFQWLFSGTGRSLHLVLLTGIVFGVLFGSLNSLLNRMMDPNDSVILTDKYFANFNNYNGNVLIAAIVIIAVVSVFGWRLRHNFDVLALGRDMAINLGIDYRRSVRQILFLVTVLVSVSTALVGPVTFFGLLVANLAYLLCRSIQHRIILPVAVLLAVIFLVGGQFMLEYVFRFNVPLSIIIEFVGGIVFILLLLKGKMR
ncbi:MAG: Transport system permease [Candidatus Tokpelaia hoelldobleri]|uniref:Transport system permease n=1 Tax=Candidatus Tokpelaia hoelldobleri TaxID=1902579 RepID=A0A1U9JTB6_9HYPH|nr:MAG: Transport system permease [Candidatus Tokpelaia hoelldoblerii]